jgi:hypothetical protein
MRIYGDNFGDIAKKSISRWGNCEEHNYGHFLSLGTSAKIPVFAGFGDDMGIIAFKSKTGKIWYMLREVLAPEEKKVEIFLEFAGYVLDELGMERLQIEVEDDFRNELLHKLEDTGLKACSVNYYLDWPLFDMERWDGDVMPGKEWKKLRNIKNKFYREHKVEVLKTGDVARNELKRIILEWREKRGGGDFANSQQYLNIIDNDFDGFDEARVLVVDARPRAITGGWKVPNSDGYYSSLGVFDYSVERLGEIANLDDLCYLKSRGYKVVNFGGSGDELLIFKKKFMPASSYRTFVFSVMKK